MRRYSPSEWLGRLSLGGKFMLLAGIFAIPTAIMLALLYVQTQRGISVAAQERRGIEYVTRLAGMLQAVQVHGIAVARAGAQGDRAPALQAAGAVDAALDAVRAIEKAHGAEFGTAERMQNLGDHWGAMKARGKALAGERSVMEHRALSEGIVDLMYFVAERSRLLLDPQARSAYLQDASVSRLPEMIAAMGQAGGVLATPGGEAGPRLAMAYQHAVKNHETATRGFVNAFGGSDVVVDDARFTAARAASEASAGALLEAVSALLRADSSARPAAQVVGLALRALEDAHRLDLAALGVLDREIAARASAERRLQLLLLAGVAASLVLSALLLVTVSRAITGSLREAMHLAGRIAEGDLTERLERRTRDEIGELVESLNLMSERMAGIVSGVKVSSDAVMASAREVAEANADLSSRTERQASSLEEMAASTEELSAAVSQSADKIHEAGSLVGDATRATRSSHETMARAVQTMRAVEEGSRRIADISTVIDGIAFQTNILALNAAVEAARVGAEGRGFAVVASEIRLLSQRSASAAREIKALIAEAVSAIENGGDLVERAGGSLDETLRTIGAASTIMEDVVAMARQQSASIEQISAAVMEMNGVTQQNAAFVQQSAQIAQRQEQHAGELVQGVGGFRLAAAARDEEAWLPAAQDRPHEPLQRARAVALAAPA